MLIDRRIVSQFDWALLILALLIPCLGLLVLYSAAYDPNLALNSSWLKRSPNFQKQAIFLGIGVGCAIIAVCLSTQFLNRIAYFVYAIGILLLLGVLEFGVLVNNARRWYSFGALKLQPAEFMKIAVILAQARWLSRHPPRYGGYGFTELIVPFLFFAVPALLVMEQPDLGTAVSLSAIGFLMVLFMGIRWKSLVIMVTGIAIAIVPIWYGVLHDYQKRRVLVLIDPGIDPKGTGYHIIQSKIAVGSGGFLGRGFLKGTQSHLEFLPEHTTDFIFSVLSEEFGFVGCMLVIVLYLAFLYRIMMVVVRGKDLYSMLVAFGVAGMFFFHVSINIGMVVGILPVVGIPLPLFSYGGSAILTNMIAIGLVLGIGARRLIFSSR